MGLEEKVKKPEAIFEEATENRVELKIGEDSYKISLSTRNGVLTNRKDRTEIRFEYCPK